MKIILTTLAFMLPFILLGRVNLYAAQPYPTLTPGPQGLVPTQQAYEPISFIALEAIVTPQDLFITPDNYLLVACSHHRHIVVLDPHRELHQIIGAGELVTPMGVATSATTGDIFVADTQYVVQFAQDGTLLQRFGRPTSEFFGETAPFRPLKIALDARDTMFIVGEAASNGLIMLNPAGEFLGYFGANQTTRTLFQALQDFFTPRGATRQFLNTPTPPTNVAISYRGAVFTVTHNLEAEVVKMLNVAGNNILPNLAGFTPIDVTMAQSHGGFYVLTSDGLIIEYNAEGEMLFAFGGIDPTVQRLGVFRQPTSLVQDRYGNLLVADALSGLIHLFAPTEFTRWVHLAMDYFEQGLYLQSMAYWEEVLRFHSAFTLAHYAIGQALFLQGDHVGARERFYIASHVGGYSDAFWEVRNHWLQTNTLTIVLIILGLVACGQLYKRTKKRIPAFTAPIFKELAHAKKILTSPADAYYDIRFHHKASVRSASIMYVGLFASFVISAMATGFIFTWDTGLDILPLAGAFAGVVALFVAINFLVATVNEGEGSFANVYIGTAYAATPFILLAVPITLLSQVLTLSEAFVYQFLFQIAIGWSLLLQCIMIKEIHDYELRDVVKNIFLTIFAGAVLVLVVFILYLLLMQVAEFIQGVVMEVGSFG